jgi:hypothetical protein
MGQDSILVAEGMHINHIISVQDHINHATDLLLGEHNGQHSVLEAVVEENISKACGDDAADTEVIDGPGSVLAGRAATEVVACNKDLAVAVLSL